MKQLEEIIGECKNPYLELHKHRKCLGQADLEEEMKKVTVVEGEGVMLRDPKSKYEYRRTETMLKVKEFHDDEATVIGHEKGTGKNEGVMGAIVCRNKAGIEFKVGSGFTDAERRKPPKKGSVITYRYFELNKKSQKPRFPTYVRPFAGM